MINDLQRLLEAAGALAEHTGRAVVVIGGVARSVWAPPRATQDLDVLFSGALDEAVVAAPAVGMEA